MSNNYETDGLTIIIKRQFKAPRNKVFAAWTVAEHIEKWWAPVSFNTRVDELDFKPGGWWRYTIVGPDGKEYPVEGVYQEIIPNEKVVASDGWKDETTNLPEGMIVTQTYEDTPEGNTLVSIYIKHEDYISLNQHLEMGVADGWNSSFTCLDEYLPEMQF